jgi:hypothetical protein
VVTVSPDLASKLVAQIFRFEHQNWQLRFSDLILKITVTISWFVPQNQASYGLSVAPQNDWTMKTARDTHQDLAACFAWK